MLATDGWRSTHPAAIGAANESDYSGLRMRVLSATKAAAYRPGPNEVAISIRGRSEVEPQLSSRFDHVLRLQFEDTGLYAEYATTGGDNPATISPEQAKEVAAFVLHHRRASSLLVQCAAGVSRSRSLAAAVCATLSLPYEWTVVNDDVYRAVMRAREARKGRAAPSVQGTGETLTNDAWAEFDSALRAVDEDLRASGADTLIEEQLTPAAEQRKQDYRASQRASGESSR
jgi:predicted protein tyrosine phosphatase